MIRIKTLEGATHDFSNNESAIEFLKRETSDLYTATNQYKGLAHVCDDALYLPSLVDFLKTNKHLRGNKICLCKYGCNFSRIQYWNFPMIRYNDGTRTWGPYIWQLIHTVAKQRPLDFWNILRSISVLLPCIECRNNFQNDINLCYRTYSAEPIAVAHEMHNRVNKRLRKPIFNESYPYKPIDKKQFKTCIECQVRFMIDLSIVTPVDKNISQLSDIEFLQMKLAYNHVKSVLRELI